MNKEAFEDEHQSEHPRVEKVLHTEDHFLTLRYMDKRLLLQLNCNRKVTGVLRGFDPFMNIVLDEAIEERSPEERIPMGLAVYGLV